MLPPISFALRPAHSGPWLYPFAPLRSSPLELATERAFLATLLHNSRSGHRSLSPLPASAHSERVRHSQFGHLVEQRAFDRSLDPLIIKSPRPELTSEHRFESKHRILGQTLPAAAARRSPSISALRLNLNRAQRCVARPTPPLRRPARVWRWLRGTRGL